MEQEIINQLLSTWGLIGLFVVAILADSILPLGGELAVVSFWVLGGSALATITVASIGNYIGAVINYLIGRGGNKVLINPHTRVFGVGVKKYLDGKWYLRAEKLFQKYGPVVLFLSFIPFIGDPLTVVAGFLKYNFRNFTLWVLSGKVFRYIAMYLIFAKYFS